MPGTVRSLSVKRRLAPWALASSLIVISAPAASETDRVAFVSNRDGNSEIYTVNVDGSGLLRLTTHSGIDEFPTWSPDGHRIAFQSDRTGSFEIYVMNADGSNVVQRTFSSSSSEHPTWSPDGDTIAYSTISDGSLNLWAVGAVSGSPSLLFSAPGWDAHPSWSPTGGRLALTSDWHMYDLVKDVFLVNTDGSGFVSRTGAVPDDVDDALPAWSPDGARISLAILPTESTAELGVMNEDGSNLEPLASAAVMTRSSWSPDGQRIVYTSATGDLVWIDADGGAAVPIITNGWNAHWSPAPKTTDAGNAEPMPVGLRVLASPSRGPVRFAIGRHEPGDAVSIFDVRGSLVRDVPLDPESPFVVWDWRQSGCAPGVYFARLRSGSLQTQAVRFVVLH